MNFTIPAGPSLNTMYRVGAHGKLYKTAAAKAWMQDCFYLIRNQCEGFQMTMDPVSVTIDVYPKDGRLRDVDGYLKLALDMLESCRVIENDRQVQLLLVERHPPRGEHELQISITPYSPGRTLPAL